MASSIISDTIIGIDMIPLWKHNIPKLSDILSSNEHGVIDDNSNSYNNMIMDAMRMN
jgi:hypothetical protein